MALAGSQTPVVQATKAYTASDQRRRLLNIQYCEKSIRACFRKHTIADYLPAQAVYNLCEYPSRERWAPNAADEAELDRLRDAGIQIVQLHHEWNDWQHLFGGDYYSPINPAGFRTFINMVHSRGMKIIVFTSTGWLDSRDPDFRREWAYGDDLVAIYFRAAHCSPASPEWRAYMLPRLLGILDKYEVDGLYNDLGYLPLSSYPDGALPNEVRAFEETPAHDGALEDLLGLVYTEVKRRGGIVKVHFGDVRAPAIIQKAYDYLWVGESTANIELLHNFTSHMPPYVVPCLDMMTSGPISREDDLYVSALPYMQFPLLLAGRIFTGERAKVPGIEYNIDDVTKHCLKVWDYLQSHPNGPYTYGWWDSVPGRPEARSRHAYWLSHYLPMVEEGTKAYIEITDSDFFSSKPSGNIVASAFANRNLYLAIANYGSSNEQVRLAKQYLNLETRTLGTTWDLPSRSLLLLRSTMTNPVKTAADSIWTQME